MPGWRTIPVALHNPSSIMTIRRSIYQGRNPDAGGDVPICRHPRPRGRHGNLGPSSIMIGAARAPAGYRAGPAEDGSRRRMTAILGISAFYHDSAAALVVDGEIVAAAQEERFTRKKHDPAFPGAGDRLLPAARPGCRADDLDYVAFYDKPLTKFERLLETYLAYAPRGLPQLPPWPCRSGSRTSCTCARTIRSGLDGADRAPLRLHRPPREPRRQRLLPQPVRRGRDPDPRRRRRVEHDDLRRRRGQPHRA